MLKNYLLMTIVQTSKIQTGSAACPVSADLPTHSTWVPKDTQVSQTATANQTAPIPINRTSRIANLVITINYLHLRGTFTKRKLRTKNKMWPWSRRRRHLICHSHLQQWKTSSGHRCLLASDGAQRSRDSTYDSRSSMRRRLASTWPSSVTLRSLEIGPISIDASLSGLRVTIGWRKT